MLGRLAQEPFFSPKKNGLKNIDKTGSYPLTSVLPPESFLAVHRTPLCLPSRCAIPDTVEITVWRANPLSLHPSSNNYAYLFLTKCLLFHVYVSVSLFFLLIGTIKTICHMQHLKCVSFLANYTHNLDVFPKHVCPDAHRQNEFRTSIYIRGEKLH